MKSVLVFFVVIISLVSCYCEPSSTFNIRETNRKQKKLIARTMDLRADPCNDFYKYACGKWHQVYQGAGINYYEPITMLDYNANVEMSDAFNNFSMENKPKFIKEAQNYYTSCKSLNKYESIRYLMWLKANGTFKWSSLWREPEEDEGKFDWVQMLAHLRTYGFNDVFIQQLFMTKVSDAKTCLIDLDKPVTDGGFQPMSKEYLKVLLQSLPAQITDSDFNKLWRQIENFEKKLKQLDKIEDVKNENENEDDYEKRILVYVKDLPLDWLKLYVKIVLNQTELNDQMQLYIQNIPYMMALDRLTKQHSQRFLCKYLEIRFLGFLIISGPDSFMASACLASARSLMPTAMHWLYEQLHPELKQEYPAINKIFENIRNRLSSAAVKYSLSKINNMKLRINNIPRIDTINTLEIFYKHLNMDPRNFYENHLKLLHFNYITRRYLLNTQTPVLDFTYLESSLAGYSSSPYFMRSMNVVFLPSTLLQPPIYSPGLDEIYKYSSLGFILAHEMFHGLNNYGVPTDAIRFKDKLSPNAGFECLLEKKPQFSDERIADINGLHYAYQAYFESYPETSNRTISLRHSEMTLNKVFFLNFAQFFCGYPFVEVIEESEYGSDYDRLKDALLHFSAFSTDFMCNSNHSLYSNKTCLLWR